MENDGDENLQTVSESQREIRGEKVEKRDGKGEKTKRLQEGSDRVIESEKNKVGQAIEAGKVSENVQMPAIIYKTQKQHLIHFTREFGTKGSMSQLQRKLRDHNVEKTSMDDCLFETQDVPVMTDLEDNRARQLEKIYSLKFEVLSLNSKPLPMRDCRTLRNKLPERVLRVRVVQSDAGKERRNLKASKKEAKNISAWLRYISSIRTTQTFDPNAPK